MTPTAYVLRHQRLKRQTTVDLNGHTFVDAPTKKDTRRSEEIAATKLGKRIEIDEKFPGLKWIHRDPDIALIDDFLTADEAASIIKDANSKGMSLSPVAYAGWTSDAAELIKLAAAGPAVWIALARVWTVSGSGAGRFELAVDAFSTWAIVTLVCSAIVAAFLKTRAQQLQGMRTSTSVTLDAQGSGGDKAFVAKTAQLLMSNWRTFEAPTVIRYETGQRLAQHFDANRDADTEDAHRGGQTLCTVLAYLNDVDESSGGRTIFNRLNLSVTPQKGQALVFFPATRNGQFDERTEHEGELHTGDAKWIARIWKHANRVPPPYGLVEGLENIPEFDAFQQPL